MIFSLNVKNTLILLSQNNIIFFNKKREKSKIDVIKKKRMM